MSDDLIRRQEMGEAIDRIRLDSKHETFYSFYQKVLKALNEVPAANRWIPCKERLPESYHNPATMGYGLYLCSCDFGDGNIDVRAFKFGNGHFLLGSGIMDRYVTAWMPLPEPYKEEEDAVD